MDDNEKLQNTVEDVYLDYCARRSALIKALTTDAREFYRQCDPERPNLCLYALPSGQWKVSLPVQETPSELPEPPLGINFARDGMLKKEWLSLIALHSDAWLIAVAYYFGARYSFDKADRQRLFNMINEHETLCKVVYEYQPSPDRSSVTYQSSSNSMSSSDVNDAEKESEDEEYVDEYDVLGECGACGDNCDSAEFGIFCHTCEKWLHGKCVKITPAKPEDIEKYKCPLCHNKGAGL